MVGEKQMSDYQILLVIAGLLLLIIALYKLPIRRCPKCKGDGRKVIHIFPARGKFSAQEMHYYECENCKFYWGDKIVTSKKKKDPS